MPLAGIETKMIERCRRCHRCHRCRRNRGSMRRRVTVAGVGGVGRSVGAGVGGVGDCVVAWNRCRCCRRNRGSVRLYLLLQVTLSSGAPLHSTPCMISFLLLLQL